MGLVEVRCVSREVVAGPHNSNREGTSSGQDAGTRRLLEIGTPETAEI